jgi:hypothetical protein
MDIVARKVWEVRKKFEKNIENWSYKEFEMRPRDQSLLKARYYFYNVH